MVERLKERIIACSERLRVALEPPPELDERRSKVRYANQGELFREQNTPVNNPQERSV